MGWAKETGAENRVPADSPERYPQRAFLASWEGLVEGAGGMEETECHHDRGFASILVRQTYLSWNTLEQSIVTMYEKLADLGWVIYNGEVHIVEPETEKSKYHV